jgi:hypothetical protein
MLIRNSNLNLALPTLQRGGVRNGANVCSSSLDYRVDTFDEITQTWSSSLGNPIGYIRNGTAQVTRDQFGICVAFSAGAYIEVSGSLTNPMYFACVTGSSMSATGAGVAGYDWSISAQSGQSTFQHIGGTVAPPGFTGNVAEQLVAFQYTGTSLGRAVLTSYLSGIRWKIAPCGANDYNLQNDARTNSGNGGYGSNFRISAGALTPLRLRAFGFGAPTEALQSEYNCRYGTPYYTSFSCP